MIEREIVTQKIKEYQLKEYLEQNLSGVGLSEIKLQRTPLGEKIIISASRPGLVIGGGGSNIKKLTRQLKRKFGLENPQIEINEIKDQSMIARVVAERIAISLEKYGSMRFKGIGHRSLSDVMNAGALGVEILISGKIPSARARTWRFYQGYLKKCGNIAISEVDVSYKIAKLKTGVVGIKVSIMTPDTRLPDDVKMISETEETVEETETEDEKLKEAMEKEEKKGDSTAEKPSKKDKKAEKVEDKDADSVVKDEK